MLKIWRLSAAETRSPRGGRTLKPGPGGSMGMLAIAFAFGFTLMVLVYTIGPISGCHINPAVTIAKYPRIAASEFKLILRSPVV